MVVFEGSSFASVYENALKTLMKGDNLHTSARGLETREMIDVALVINDPIASLYENETRGSQKKYIAAELMWYFLGRDDVEFIKEYASFWTQIQNEDGTANSSYGKLLFGKTNRFGKTQYEWAIESLEKDKDSRQAVMHFNLPEHQYEGNKDFVCTMYGIFQIRNNKLNFTVNMRSNDAVWGTPTDIAFFTVLQQQMLTHLRITYPELELGKYTHIVNSFHVYKRHYKIVENMINGNFDEDRFPIMEKSLIHTNGTPSSDLRLLSNHYKDSNTNVISDPIYTWIQENINENVNRYEKA